MVTIVCGIPYFLSIDHTDGLCKQSKAFRKSMKFIITGFSATLLLSQWSAWAWISDRCMIFLAWIPLVLFAGASPHHLSICSALYLETLCLGLTTKWCLANCYSQTNHLFFGKGIIMPSLQSVGTSCFCHTVLNRFARRSLIDSACFSNSGWMWSEPAALPFFSFLTARATSSSIFDFTYSNQIFRCSKYQLLTYIN